MATSIFERYENIIVLDTETTGIDFRRDEIIELACARISGGKMLEESDSFITLSLGRTLPAEIVRLTGITQEMLDGEGEDKRAVCEAFCRMIDRPDTMIAAYNAQFDLCFLFYFLKAFGMEGCLKNKGLFDILSVYKDRREYPHKLCNAVEQYSLETQNTHRAIDDTKAAYELMLAMERERGDLEKYINLFGYNPKYGVSGPRISSVNYAPQPYNSKKKLYELPE